ncbi:hypothetical protein [Teredinibacter turnerae]|uniref:hypothetical protein n=1 Tax=Teredinibacter turnerae TaxID=2426 RepID=UPI0030CC4FEC
MRKQFVLNGVCVALLALAGGCNSASSGAGASVPGEKVAPPASDFIQQQLAKRAELMKSLTDEQRQYYLAPFNPNTSQAVAQERVERVREREKRTQNAERPPREREPRERPADERKQRPVRDDRYMR